MLYVNSGISYAINDNLNTFNCESLWLKLNVGSRSAVTSGGVLS